MNSIQFVRCATTGTARRLYAKKYIDDVSRDMFMLSGAAQGLISLTIFPSSFKFDGNLFCSHSGHDKVIAMKFCTWRDSCVVVKLSQNCVALWYHTMELRQFQFSIGFEWLWKKLFVKWAPGYCTQHTLTPTCFAEKLGLHVYHFLFWSRLRFFDTFTIWCLGGKTKTMKTCSLDSNRIRDISCIMWHVKRLTDQTSSRVSQLRLVTLKATWHMYAFTRCSMWTAQDTKPSRFELLTYFNYTTAWACSNSAIKLDWYCSFFSVFGYDFSQLIFIIFFVFSLVCVQIFPTPQTRNDKHGCYYTRLNPALKINELWRSLDFDIEVYDIFMLELKMHFFGIWLQLHPSIVEVYKGQCCYYTMQR